MGRKAEGEHRTVVSNRKARHDYEILERFETGIVLTGSEVKSLRAGRGSLAEAYGRVRDGEVWIEGMHVPPYEQAMDKRTHDPIRPRKLLLHRDEIDRLAAKTREKGQTIVPLALYFLDGRAKVEIALARGKKDWDKRQALRERQDNMESQRAMRERRDR